LRQPGDVARFALLQHISVPQAWGRWLERHGVRHLNPLGGPQFDQFHSLIRAVSVGMGLALVPRCLVQDDMDAGSVQAPLEDPHLEDMGYYLCYPEARAHLAPLLVFRQWLLEQCALEA